MFLLLRGNMCQAHSRRRFEASLFCTLAKQVSKSLLHMTIAHVYNEHIMHT